MRKLYHLYNSDFEITEAQYFEEGSQPENAVYIEFCNFKKPMFNPITSEVYEGATPEEIAESEKEIVPEKVKKSNFKLALIKVGISTSVITEAIYAMPASLQKDKIIILWEDTDVFYRKDESLNEMAPSFNITQEQLDQLFILADTL